MLHAGAMHIDLTARWCWEMEAADGRQVWRGLM